MCKVIGELILNKKWGRGYRRIHCFIEEHDDMYMIISDDKSLHGWLPIVEYFSVEYIEYMIPYITLGKHGWFVSDVTLVEDNTNEDTTKVTTNEDTTKVITNEDITKTIANKANKEFFEIARLVKQYVFCISAGVNTIEPSELFKAIRYVAKEKSSDWNKENLSIRNKVELVINYLENKRRCFLDEIRFT